MKLCPVQGELEFDRVKSAIATSIVEFIRARLASDERTFHADDLRRHVAKIHPTAPASADRVLRALRQEHRLDYRVVNRRSSLYEALELAQRAA